MNFQLDPYLIIAIALTIALSIDIAKLVECLNENDTRGWLNELLKIARLGNSSSHFINRSSKNNIH